MGAVRCHTAVHGGCPSLSPVQGGSDTGGGRSKNGARARAPSHLKRQGARDRICSPDIVCQVGRDATRDGQLLGAEGQQAPHQEGVEFQGDFSRGKKAPSVHAQAFQRHTATLGQAHCETPGLQTPGRASPPPVFPTRDPHGQGTLHRQPPSPCYPYTHFQQCVSVRVRHMSVCVCIYICVCMYIYV